MKWKRKEVSLEHLRIFRSAAFVLKSKEKRDKLDAKSVKMYFLGYGTNMFGYMCWNPETKEMVRSKNVVFLETEVYKHMATTSGEIRT